MRARLQSIEKVVCYLVEAVCSMPNCWRIEGSSWVGGGQAACVCVCGRAWRSVEKRRELGCGSCTSSPLLMNNRPSSSLPAVRRNRADLRGATNQSNSRKDNSSSSIVTGKVEQEESQGATSPTWSLADARRCARSYDTGIKP
jgi:hypothetical protein